MKAAALVLLASCASTPSHRVELAPAPTASASEAPLTGQLDEIACKPPTLVAIDPRESGRLDEERLLQALDLARDFAQRCCNGDESGDATVEVTVEPAGYQTKVAIEPERLATGATGECLYATFRRILVKSYEGEPAIKSVVVHLR